MILKTPRDVGALIRQARRDARLDQAALAAKVGVSRWWINEIERGKPRAELGLVLRTLLALGVQLTAGPLSDQDWAPTKPTPADVLTRARETPP